MLYCLPHHLCGTTLHCISTYVGPLCIALFTSSVPMWDHFVLHQYLCGTTLYCTVYLISTYVGPLCISCIYLISRPMCVTTLYCTVTVYLINTYVGLLCIASVPMWDHFVLFTSSVYLISTYVFTSSDHFALQYLCTYVGLCIWYTHFDHFAPFTSPVPMWDHIVLYQYICGTTLYCTVYFTSTYLDHFVLQQ